MPMGSNQPNIILKSYCGVKDINREFIISIFCIRSFFGPCEFFYRPQSDALSKLVLVYPKNAIRLFCKKFPQNFQVGQL